MHGIGRGIGMANDASGSMFVTKKVYGQALGWRHMRSCNNRTGHEGAQRSRSHNTQQWCPLGPHHCAGVSGIPFQAPSPSDASAIARRGAASRGLWDVEVVRCQALYPTASAADVVPAWRKPVQNRAKVPASLPRGSSCLRLVCGQEMHTHRANHGESMC